MARTCLDDQTALLYAPARACMESRPTHWSRTLISWDAIDTVLLDMDGTLLDLAYDNTLWTRWCCRSATARPTTGESEVRPATHLFGHMDERQGPARVLLSGLLGRVHRPGHGRPASRAGKALIRFRPNARGVPRAHGRARAPVRAGHQRPPGQSGREEPVIPISSRPARRSGLLSRLRRAEGKSEDILAQELMDEHPFDPDRTLLIDDNAAVLDSAAAIRRGPRAHGGAARLSQRPPRTISSTGHVADFRRSHASPRAHPRGPPVSGVRLDRWLWAARFFRTRAQAKAAIEGGKVDYPSEGRASDSAIQAQGQQGSGARRLSHHTQRLDRGDGRRATRSPSTRGNATAARALYTETTRSIERREAEVSRRRMERAGLKVPGFPTVRSGPPGDQEAEGRTADSLKVPMIEDRPR